MSYWLFDTIDYCLDGIFNTVLLGEGNYEAFNYIEMGTWDFPYSFTGELAWLWGNPSYTLLKDYYYYDPYN